MAGKLIFKIAASFVTVCAICAASAVLSSADTLADYQKRQLELDEKAAEYQSIINSTSSDIEKQEEYQKALQDKITVLNTQISEGRNEILSLDSEIQTLQGEIDESRAQISDRMEKLKKRIRVLYMSGETSSLEIILGAKDFSDFMDKLELVTYISRSDESLINSLNEDIDEINVKRSKLKDTKTALQNEQKQLDTRQKELQSLITANEKLLKNLYEEKSGAQDHLDEMNEERKVIEDQIAAYYKNKEAQANTSKIASEAKKNVSTIKTTSKTTSRTVYRQSEMMSLASRATSSQSTTSQYEDVEQPTYYDDDDDSDDYYDSSSTYYDDDDSDDEITVPTQSSAPAVEPEPEPVVSSGYVWPVPGHYILSSVWNEDRTTYNHGAIDISDGSIMNAEIVAAEEGVVVLGNFECDHNYGKDGSCGCGGGYGIYVMIDHGGDKATLYAHMTSAVVNIGDYVQKGQLIGYVGTTGWSTGPHLHFETRYQGEKYNPMTEYPNF